MFVRLTALILATLLMTSTSQAKPTNQSQQCPHWLDHELPKLNSSQTLQLCALVDNRVTLIVNTASHCGFTHQFESLQALYDQYADQGFLILGFPSNDFKQEAKDEAKIATYCYENYGVTFPMSSPIKVRGKDANPIFQHLANETTQPRWNFNKYLVSRDGSKVEHFGSMTAPDSKKLTQAIERLLAEE